MVELESVLCQPRMPTTARLSAAGASDVEVQGELGGGAAWRSHRWP
jgi:hypothetical protein